MKKKILAMLVSSMLVLSLTACGESGETEDTATEETVEATEEATEETTEDASDVAESVEKAVDEEADASDSGASFTLWEAATLEAPDLSDTSWSFAGGYIDGAEMTQEELDAALEQYGGQLQFTFDADGGAQMVQGGGTLTGSYEAINEASIGVSFDNNGSELSYGCIFTEMDGDVVMIAVADEAGENGIYFVQD